MTPTFLPVPPPRHRQRPPNPAVMTAIFSGIVLVGLAVAYVLGLRPWMLAKEAERWRETPCRVEWSGVGSVFVIGSFRGRQLARAKETGSTGAGEIRPG